MSPSFSVRLPLLTLLICIAPCFTANLSAQVEDAKFLAEMGISADTLDRAVGADLFVQVEQQRLVVRMDLSADLLLLLPANSPEAMKAYPSARTYSRQAVDMDASQEWVGELPKLIEQ